MLEHQLKAVSKQKPVTNVLGKSTYLLVHYFAVVLAAILSQCLQFVSQGLRLVSTTSLRPFLCIESVRANMVKLRTACQLFFFCKRIVACVYLIWRERGT